MSSSKNLPEFVPQLDEEAAEMKALLAAALFLLTAEDRADLLRAYAPAEL